TFITAGSPQNADLQTAQIECGLLETVHVYRTPASASSVEDLACDAEVTILTRTGGYAEVRTSRGTEGWVIDRYLTRIKTGRTKPLPPAELADSLLAQKRYELALRQYREAIRINPKDAHLHFNLAFVLFELKRYEEAVLSYREVVQLDPKSDEAQFNLGLTLW